ncbi:MAG: formylmethanofuran dehydrogenase subunit B [Planctomycetes bacterium]|nr:formylmethanofuran dehydrogenase subunit B [Planctomycetota bacterium]
MESEAAPRPPSSEKMIENVACTICGCVCDDLRITVREGRVVETEGACELAEPWLLAQNTQQPPATQMAGEAASFETAVEEAARILSQSRAPLIYGLSRSSTPGQRAAVRLADRIGATIDTTASRCHAPSIMAFQQAGESTCSLGEAKNRCNLVLFWGSNPVKSHPRHFERYSVDPPGMFLPGGRADRYVVAVDVRPTETTEQVDWFLQIPPGGDFDALWTLRAMVAGVDVPDSPGIEDLRKLADRMTSCRSGIVYFGLGLTRHGTPHANVEALLRLVTDLNRHTRFYARRMRMPGDVAGADSVLCWTTGFPFSVNLARGYPRYNPGEYSANEVLERGETDACLLVGSEGVEQLSPAAQEQLRRIPTIVLDYPTETCPFPPTVAFTTAVYGVHLPGTAYRMDETPIPLRTILPSDYPSDAEVLDAIVDRLRPMICPH